MTVTLILLVVALVLLLLAAINWPQSPISLGLAGDVFLCARSLDRRQMMGDNLDKVRDANRKADPYFDRAMDSAIALLNGVKASPYTPPIVILSVIATLIAAWLLFR